MIKLIEPEEQYLKSYMEAYQEFQENNISTYGLTDAKSEDIFKKFYHYRNEINLLPDRVGAHYYWLVDDEKIKFIGEITIRHQLTENLFNYGGHIRILYKNVRME